MLILATASLSACVGRKAVQSTSVSTTTTGQELTDLQSALDNGLITQQEFDKKRKAILKE
jgi:hypothetical protein